MEFISWYLVSFDLIQKSDSKINVHFEQTLFDPRYESPPIP